MPQVRYIIWCLSFSDLFNIIISESVKVKVAQLCPTFCDPTECSLWNSPGQNTGVGSLSLLQGIFSKPGMEPRCPTSQVDSLPAEPHKGSLSILEWVVYPFPRGSLSYQRSRSIHIAANGIISLLFMAEYYSIVYMYNLLYLFICWWILRLLPCLGCYK